MAPDRYSCTPNGNVTSDDTSAKMNMNESQWMPGRSLRQAE